MEVIRGKEVHRLNSSNYYAEERWIKYTVDTDVQFTEVHVVINGKLYDDVSGWQ